MTRLILAPQLEVGPSDVHEGGGGSWGNDHVALVPDIQLFPSAYSEHLHLPVAQQIHRLDIFLMVLFI